MLFERFISKERNSPAEAGAARRRGVAGFGKHRKHGGADVVGSDGDLTTKESRPLASPFRNPFWL